MFPAVVRSGQNRRSLFLLNHEMLSVPGGMCTLDAAMYDLLFQYKVCKHHRHESGFIKNVKEKSIS